MGGFAALCRHLSSSKDAFLNEKMATLQQINSSCGFVFSFGLFFLMGPRQNSKKKVTGKSAVGENA